MTAPHCVDSNVFAGRHDLDALERLTVLNPFTRSLDELGLTDA